MLGESSARQPVEISGNDDAIYEVRVDRGSIHIARADGDTWHTLVEGHLLTTLVWDEVPGGAYRFSFKRKERED